jgi:hypothetical protein
MAGMDANAWDCCVGVSREKGDSSAVCAGEVEGPNCVGARIAGIGFLRTGGGSRYIGPLVGDGISTRVKDDIAGVG